MPPDLHRPADFSLYLPGTLHNMSCIVVTGMWTGGPQLIKHTQSDNEYHFPGQEKVLRAETDVTRLLLYSDSFCFAVVFMSMN